MWKTIEIPKIIKFLNFQIRNISHSKIWLLEILSLTRQKIFKFMHINFF